MEEAVKILNWDSQFFGYKIASLRVFNLKKDKIELITRELKIQGVKLVYFFVDPSDELSAISLNKASGLLVDKKVTYIIKLTEDAKDYHEDMFVIPYQSSIASEKLKSLALQSGLYSRFRVDPNFRNNEFEKLYLEWIEKSIRKEIAKKVLIYREDQNSDEKGLITLGITGDSGSIGLLAVDQDYRGKSIGRKLVQAAFKYFEENKVKTVEVVTQAENKGACNFYESMGFAIKNTVNIYHLWIN